MLWNKVDLSFPTEGTVKGPLVYKLQKIYALDGSYLLKVLFVYLVN